MGACRRLERIQLRTSALTKVMILSMRRLRGRTDAMRCGQPAGSAISCRPCFVCGGITACRVSNIHRGVYETAEVPEDKQTAFLHTKIKKDPAAVSCSCSTAGPAASPSYHGRISYTVEILGLTFLFYHSQTLFHKYLLKTCKKVYELEY